MVRVGDDPGKIERDFRRFGAGGGGRGKFEPSGVEAEMNCQLAFVFVSLFEPL